MAQIPQSTGMIQGVSKPEGFAKYIEGVHELFNQGEIKIGTSLDGQVEKIPARTGDYIVYVNLSSSNVKALSNWSEKAADAGTARRVSARPRRGSRALPAGAIGFEATVGPGGEKIIVPFGEIRKPTGGANLGDVAEGVMAIALACRFKDYRHGGNVTSDDILAVCKKLKSGLGMGVTKTGVNANAGSKARGFAVKNRGKGKEIQAIFQTPNYGMVDDYVDDDLCLYIGLSAANMKFLLDAGDKKPNQIAMKNMLAGSAAYANGDKVKKWAHEVYNNRRYDFIECRAVGLAGSAKGTKVDVEVNITDDEGEPRTIMVGNKRMGVDIKISLKHGGVEQFGQKGGTDWENSGRTMGYEKYFNTLFGDSISVSSYGAAFKEAKGPKTGSKSSQNFRIRNAVGGLYQSVAKDIQTQLKEGGGERKRARTKFYQNLAKGIIDFATLNQEFVHLVQLTANEARIYNFEKLPLIWADGEPLYEVEYKTYDSKVAKGPLPKITIKEPGTTGKSLFVFRVKAETVNGQPYYRNYIEKGSALKNLKDFVTGPN